MTSIHSAPFRPRRREPCFCQSGKLFKECCGNAKLDRVPPHGLTLAHHFWNETECAELVSLADQCSKDWLSVGDVDTKTGEHVGEKIDKGRITQAVILGSHQHLVNEKIRRIWRDVVQPELDVEIEWFEQPSILCYTKGGLYGSHADSDYHNTELDRWERKLDRDLSMLVYINAEFEGGDISFVNFDYRYSPQMGDLLVFPSDQRYRHRAEEVTAGTRYCIVSWAAVKGGARVNAVAPAHALAMSESEGFDKEAIRSNELSEPNKSSWWSRLLARF